MAFCDWFINFICITFGFVSTQLRAVSGPFCTCMMFCYHRELNQTSHATSTHRLDNDLSQQLVCAPSSSSDDVSKFDVSTTSADTTSYRPCSDGWILRLGSYTYCCKKTTSHHGCPFYITPVSAAIISSKVTNCFHSHNAMMLHNN